MSSRRLLVGFLILAILAAACTPSGDTPVTTTEPSSTTSTTITGDEDVCRSGDLPYTDSGLIAALGEDDGDATTISSIQWDPHPTCERLALSFASGSTAPAATLGPAAAFLDAPSGVIVVELPAEVDTTALADLVVEGELIDRVYIVRSETGAISVHLHPAANVDIAARAFVTEAPVSLVLDVVPGRIGTRQVTVPTSETVAITSPTEDSTTYPFVVDGYAAPGLGRVDLRLSTSSVVAAERTLSLTAYPDTWQSFSVTIDDGPSGPLELFVGTLGPEGQPDTGVTQRLELE